MGRATPVLEQRRRKSRFDFHLFYDITPRQSGIERVQALADIFAFGAVLS